MVKHRTVNSIRLAFRWDSGPYITVCRGTALAHPQEVIKVWTYEKNVATVPFTSVGMSKCVDEWIDEYGRAELAHDVSLNWL